MAAEKRGFGLVGDYGSDLSSSSDEEGEAVKKKAKNQEQSSQDVDPAEERQRREQERLKEREEDKWAGVRKEYDDSSLMYKYVTEDENRPEATTNPASGAGLSDEARQTIYKEAYEASLYHRNERKNAEQQALDWEIAQIQNDIEDQRKRTIELVMFVFAKPAAPTPEQSFTIFKEAAESVKDIEELVAMRFADFEAAAREGKRAPAVVRLKTKPWAGKRLRGRLEVSSRDSLWRRVVEMSKGSVDLINAHTGKELPQAFKTAGLNENSV